MIKVSFAAPSVPETGAIAVLALDGRKLSPTGERLDQATGGALTRAMKESRFQGKKDQIIVIPAPSGVKATRIVLLGIGKPADFDELAAQNLGGRVVGQLGGTSDTQVAIAADQVKGLGISVPALAANIAHGAVLGSYRFDKYRTKEKPEDKPTLGNVRVMTRDAAKAKAAYAPLEKIGEGVFFTRDLVSEPANVIYPETLAREARSLTRLGVKVDVLGVAEMRKLGMGALLGVAQGSAHEPRLIVMRWNGAPRAREKRPIAFVGKGVTFDTGGISIKPAGGMEDMKWDMGGAGVVIGLMRALAGRKAKVNAIGIGGLVENMPSGTAQRPGDVVKTMSGQTVEVINTDAEGRLVLGDALWYVQDKFKPHTVINLATLTGAIIVSLGHEMAGLFSNDDRLSDRLIAAGKAVGELLWRMPLSDAYDRDINSDIADMKNVGAGRAAGSIAAAQFLKRYIQDGVKWAHLDIAGVTWASKAKPIVPKGGTAFGVRLLERLVRDHYESRG
jgi:leucyl aminopeptidase